jgi:hypothetical protein
MKVLTIYISGPISGLPDGNRPAFAEMAATLRLKGWEVVNPHDLFAADVEESWEGYMRKDLAALLTCTHIVLLPGWEQSRGARLEQLIADAVGILLVERP